MQEVVQARMMEQVVSCKDEIAQQYLMQCIIQGFPDEFHLGTLPTLLAALPELQEGVRVHLILASLLDRLSRCCSLCGTHLKSQLCMASPGHCMPPLSRPCGGHSVPPPYGHVRGRWGRSSRALLHDHARFMFCGLDGGCGEAKP